MARTPNLNGFKTSVGLHKLKDKCRQKSDMGVQSDWLAKNLAAVIAATENAVVGRKDYRLSRLPPPAIDKSEKERIWERAVYEKWSGNEDASSVANCWKRVIAFQVPLFGQASKNSWGYIDLLGYSGSGTPVVIELKKEPATKQGRTNSSETPLRMVVEAAAYAVALRANWDTFRDEYRDCLVDRYGVDKKRIPKQLQKIQLVGAAPASFWMDWLPVTGKGCSDPLNGKTWKSFSTLLKKLEQNGFPVSFVSLSGDPYNLDSLAAQPLVNFPPMGSFGR
jgi:hypothetical protein